MKSDVYNLLKLNTRAKKAILITGLFFLSVSLTLTAQEVNKFSGVVQSESGEPMPGVNVLEKGTSNGTVSEIDGTFRISSAKEKVVLAFSMVGFETIEKELST